MGSRVILKCPLFEKVSFRNEDRWLYFNPPPSIHEDQCGQENTSTASTASSICAAALL